SKAWRNRAIRSAGTPGGAAGERAGIAVVAAAGGARDQHGDLLALIEIRRRLRKAMLGQTQRRNQARRRKHTPERDHSVLCRHSHRRCWAAESNRPDLPRTARLPFFNPMKL